MTKTMKRILSVLLAVVMLATMGIPALAADTSSNEYQFFSLLDRSATGLTSAYNTGTSTGNWTAAKEQLLNYYKTKFAGINYLTNDYGNGTAETALHDTLLFTDSERYLSKQTVTTTMQQISIPLSAGNVRADYILATLQHSDTSGILMYPKERGTTYAPKLSVTFTDNTSQDFNVSGDTYVRATGKNQTNSYASTAWGTSNPNELWAMHRSDTSNQMPYSNDEMRTYIKFDYSLPSGKSVKSGSIKIYAQVKNPNSGTPASGTTLEVMAFSPCFNDWTESNLTWNYIKNIKSFTFYSWDGLGGIIYNESLYGTKFEDLGLTSEFIQGTSRFQEEASLCQAGYYQKAKEMILRFADQTYDLLKNASTSSGGYPRVHPIGTANRMLVFPVVYKTLLAQNVITAEENYKILRWFYQEIQYNYKDKSGNIFVNGGATPNTDTCSYRDNFGPWFLTASYNAFGFFPEFTESTSWRSMFESRLSLMANVFLNPDGSYIEVTFGYPSAVLSWYSRMLDYMKSAGYTSAAVETLKQNLIDLVKYMVDCVYPNGYMPKYGDGGSVYIRNTINSLFAIKGISENTSKNLKNLLYYKTNGEQGIAPETNASYPDAKIVTDRTGWTANDSMLFMNAKGGGIHSHADSLSVLMYTKGREMLVDKGHTTYDPTNEGFALNNRTYTHNTVEVDGTGQRHPGSSGATVATGYDGTADNIKQYSNSSVNTIRAYTTSNVNAKHYRNVTWVKDFDNLLLVNDWVQSNNSSTRSCTQNWHALPDANPATTSSRGGFTGNWGYTNFNSGANMMISQATPNGDGNNSITTSVKTGPDSNSSTRTSQYFEFAQSGTNVTYNTAVATYNGTSMGIRTMKMDTGVKDYVASAMQVQRFNNSSLSTLVDEVAYYNSFETTPAERTVLRRQDSQGKFFMFKTNTSNALFHVRLNETVDSLSISNGTKLDTYMASTITSTEETPMARINTSQKVTDLYAKYDVNTGVVSLETSDKNVIRGVTQVTVEFRQFDNISAVKLNGETLSEGVSISGKTAIISAVPASWDKEYYYPSGTRFVKNIALCFYGDESTCWREIRSAVGGVNDENAHIFPGTYSTYYDDQTGGAFIYQDLASGTGNGKFIAMGYNTTTNPTAANACKGVGVETTAYTGSCFDDSITESVRGKTLTWYLANNGGSNIYNPKLHSDGAVDLNANAGGATIKTYAVYDRDFGPAIDAIAVVRANYGETITNAQGGNSAFAGPGWYTGIATNAPDNLPDLNSGAGGDTLYMYYHTPCVEVNSAALRANYAELQQKYNNISTYTLTSPTTTATIQAALNTAQAIINDLKDGYTTYTQAQITAAANECAAQSGRMTQIVTLKYNINGGTSTVPADKTFTFGADNIVTAAAPTSAIYVVSFNADGGSAVSLTQSSSPVFSGWKSSVTGNIIDALTSTTSEKLVGTTYSTPVTLTAQWTPSAITLPSTSKTGYTFAGWKCSADNSIKSAGSFYAPTGNVTMTAQWTANTFSVKFNGNGATGGSMSNQSFSYGTAQTLTANGFERKYTVKFNSEGGTTCEDMTSTYTFEGWATSETGAKVYNNRHSVSNLTDVNGGEYQLYAVWTSERIILPSPIKTGFTFTGWYSGSTKIGDAFASYTPSANITLQAHWSVNAYSVTFVNYNGTELQSGNWDYGETPVYSGETPQRPGNVQYSYVFSGWAPNISEVTGNATYTARFSAVLKTYTVTWADYDGTVLETDENVQYGTIPTYNGSTPRREQNAQYNYVFKGWSPSVESVTGNATYTAQYNNNIRKYTVRWLDEDGSVLKTQPLLPYGTMPSYGSIPEKDDAQYRYTFTGWTPEVTQVTGNADYTAVYDKELKYYTITFLNENGSVLQTSEYAYGETPQYTGETPQKMYNSDKHYTFSGWDIEIMPVTGDEYYYAVYEESQHSLTYISDGAAHHGECACGYQTESEQHIIGSDGKCTRCGVDASMFYIDFGDVTISENGASGYDVNGNLITTGVLTKYVVTQLNPGRKADHSINVVSGTSTVELQNINIERTGMNAYAVSVQGTANAAFIITGENHITSGTYRAGLDIAVNAVATLEGDGTLYAQSPLQAGIGGGNGRSNGTLIINSGDIYATGGIDGYSAGIGGGTSGKGGNITINGGYVVAVGGSLASGIGGGNGFTGGNITINGGTVTATGGQGGAGIGGGYTANGGNIIINGGTVKAIAGTGAEAIGNGYKCTTEFAGVHNEAGNEVSLHILDTGNADRVYFNGIDTSALRHHPDDNSYYFYTDSNSAVTAYTNDTVKFYIGADLTETSVYTTPCYRKGEYLLVKDTQNATSSSEFIFTNNGELIYAEKVIDRATLGLIGDVNLDGRVDGEDSILVNCIIVGLLTQANLEPIQYAAADYNLDGDITSTDVSLLEEAGLLGTVSTLNAEQDAAEAIEIETIDEEQQTSSIFVKVENFFTAVVSKISDVFG